MRRLYFLLPDKASCHKLVGELKDVGVPEKHLHVVAGIAQSLDDLPEANIWQKSELIHGIEIGVGVGGAAGLIGGLLAVTFPPAGLVLGGGALLAGTTAAGAGFGAVVSAMMKSHEHNHKLDRYHTAIERGELLLLVDVPAGRVEETREMILHHHPEARIDVAVPKRNDQG